MYPFFIGLEGNNASSIIDANEAGEVKIQLLSPPEIGFHYELSFFKSGNTTVEASGNLGKVSLGKMFPFVIFMNFYHFKTYT